MGNVPALVPGPLARLSDLLVQLLTELSLQVYIVLCELLPDAYSKVGLGRIVALYHRLSASYQIC